MQKKILLLEDDPGSATVVKRLGDDGCEVVIADNLYDLVRLLEKGTQNYFAVLLDAAVGEAIILDNNGQSRVFNDSQKMNGWEYYRRDQTENPTEKQKEAGWGKRILTPYIKSGRLGFYSAYIPDIKKRARSEDISIDGCKFFDKSIFGPLLADMRMWITKIEKQEKLKNIDK